MVYGRAQLPQNGLTRPTRCLSSLRNPTRSSTACRAGPRSGGVRLWESSHCGWDASPRSRLRQDESARSRQFSPRLTTDSHSTWPASWGLRPDDTCAATARNQEVKLSRLIYRDQVRKTTLAVRACRCESHNSLRTPRSRISTVSPAALADKLTFANFTISQLISHYEITKCCAAAYFSAMTRFIAHCEILYLSR